MYNGITIAGDGRGKKMGFPTLNILLHKNPEKTGVFLVSVLISKKKYFGLLHLGPRPTFHQNQFRIEIFLLEFSGSIPLHTEISFSKIKYIREVKEFVSKEKLIEQIKKDRIFAEKYIENHEK